MKKFIAMLSVVVLCCSYSPVCVNAVEETSDVGSITVENSPELWERFLKYDLCILDYDSLTDEDKDLCRFIFETELNSKHTIICERARRILDGYDVGRRATLEDTEKYYDFADFGYTYTYAPVVYDTITYQKYYLDVIPDIRYLDSDIASNEYWFDDKGTKRIISSSDISDNNYWWREKYTYVECNEYGDWIWYEDIERPDVEFETISDDTYTYVVYPDNTLYVLKSDEHLESYEIPEEVDGMKVVGIKTHAFEKESCYSVTFPESIEYIEPFAFAECNFLKEVTLPENLKCLGVESFMGCSSLKNININCPNLMYTFSVFRNCNAENVFLNFKHINSTTLSTFESINNLVIGDDVEKLGTLFANSKLMGDYNYTIPETVKAITNDIFAVYNQYYTEDLVVPETIKVFGAYCAPAYGRTFLSNLLGYAEPSIAVIENKCYLSNDTEISGYYGTEAHSYALAHNLKFNPLDDVIPDDVIYGDTNNDGKINIADAVLLQQYLLGNVEISGNADANQDGVVDIFDMVYMRKLLIG